MTTKTVQQDGTTSLNKVTSYVTENFGGVFAGTLVTYGLIEVVHHLILEQYVLAWLMSTGLSTTIAMGLYYAALIGVIGLVSWGIWRLFVKQTE